MTIFDEGNSKQEQTIRSLSITELVSNYRKYQHERMSKAKRNVFFFLFDQIGGSKDAL